MKSDKWAERLRAGFNLSAAEMFDLSSDLAILEAEVRERERAAFVAGANFDAECEHDGLWDGGGDFEKIMDEEAFRRYPKEEKA